MRIGLSVAPLLVSVMLLAGAPADGPGGEAARSASVGAATGSPATAPAPARADTCEERERGAPESEDAAADAREPAARGAAAPADTPDGEELMRRAASVYDTLRTLQARFHQTIEMQVFDPPRRREGHGRWYQRRPSLFRMDFTDPEEDLIVADGQHLWLYYPSTHPGQVIQSRLGSRRRGAAMVDLQGRIFELARTRYDVRYVGRDTLDGASVHRVELTPETSEADYRRVGVWLDAGSLLVRRLVFEDRGQTVRTVTLDDIRTGVSLPDSLFHFRIPETAEVFQG